MAKLTVSGAARAVGLSRQYLYKAYIKNGILSIERDEKGNPLIDSSELIRVFGEIKDSGVSTSIVNSSQLETQENDIIVARLQAQLDAKDELLRRAEEQLRVAGERELWLRQQLERAQAILTDQRQANRPWWKFW
ncbi:MAG: hypothetical protein K0041_08520 [Acidithiobacillus sp.]|jgi:hypothetical protein|nr:hypothetical protein [Acidithiobacillus sp.]